MDKLRDVFPYIRRKYLKVVDGNTVREPQQQQPVYTCLKCHDAGYLRADVSYGHPQFGKPLKCECTIAKEQAVKQQALENMSGIVRYSLYEQATFRTYNKRIPGVIEAYNAAIAFAYDPDGWLVLVGEYGCGKTHLAVAIAKMQLEQGKAVLVQTVPDLLDNLRTTFDPKAEMPSYNDLFEDMKTVDLLVLDDYGAENTTPWAVEKLFQILNYRYSAALPTVITTNNIGLEGIDGRIRSRLHDKSLVNVIEIEAKDYRPQLPVRTKAGE